MSLCKDQRVLGSRVEKRVSFKGRDKEKVEESGSSMKRIRTTRLTDVLTLRRRMKRDSRDLPFQDVHPSRRVGDIIGTTSRYLDCLTCPTVDGTSDGRGLTVRPVHTITSSGRRPEPFRVRMEAR